MLKKTIIICFLFLFALISSLLLVKKNVFAGWVLTKQGQLIYESQGAVLGREEKATDLERKTEVQQERQVNQEEQEEVVTTRQLSRQEGKVILERKDQRIKVRLQNELGEEEELPEGTESAEFEIEDSEDENKTTIKSTGNAFIVIRNKIAAQTHFPLMVNLLTNELIVTTPAGQKVVTILPDAAVQHMLAANVLDQLGGKGGLLWLATQPTATPSATPTVEATPSATPTESLTPTPTGEITVTPTETVIPTEIPTPTPTTTESAAEETITLTTTQEGVLAYEIPGLKFKKLLGVWKVSLKRTAVVSAETGELLSIQESPSTRILDLLSF